MTDLNYVDEFFCYKDFSMESSELPFPALPELPTPDFTESQYFSEFLDLHFMDSLIEVPLTVPQVVPQVVPLTISLEEKKISAILSVENVSETSTEAECSELYRMYLRIMHRVHNKNFRSGTTGNKKRRPPTQFHPKIRNCSLFNTTAQKRTRKTRLHRARVRKNCT